MSVPAGTVSKLPSAQLARMEAIRADEAANAAKPPGSGQDVTTTDTNTPGAAPAGPTTPNADTDTNVSGEVRFTREEANEMRARAERTAAAEGRAELLAMELAEANARLTAAPGASKDGSNGVAPAGGADSTSFSVDIPVGEISAEDQEAYGDSAKFISIIVKREISGVIKTVLDQVDKRLKGLEQNVSNVSSATARAAHNNFTDSVKKEIGNFDAVVNHKHWKDFLESRVPGAGITQQQALANAHHGQDMGDMKVIFNTFTQKYLGEETGGSYAGVNNTDSGSAPAANVAKVMLKMSDRRKASEDYLKQRITLAQLEEVKTAFAKADKEGRVDYEN